MRLVLLVSVATVHGAWLSLPSRITSRTRSPVACAAWTTHETDEGATYYFNAATGESTWEPPPSVATGAAGDDDGSWSEHTTEEGETYFYNSVDGSSSWELPAGARVAEASPPDPSSTTSDVELREHWLDPAASRQQRSLGGYLRNGELVVEVPNVASVAELEALLAAGVAACDVQRERSGTAPADGKNRFSVSDAQAFEAEVVLNCEEVLLRVLDRVDEQMPSVYEELFKPSDEWMSRQAKPAQGRQLMDSPPDYLVETCPTLRDLYMAGELEWSEGEPAINVYTTDGGFGTHKDHMALTMLIPLTAPTAFSGGGTGFWAGNGQTDESPEGPPTTVLKPALGAALVFGGDVTHAGMPVADGLRSVMVASFSTRTPSSPEERVHGLQFATSSSSLREQSRLRHNLS